VFVLHVSFVHGRPSSQSPFALQQPATGAKLHVPFAVLHVSVVQALLSAHWPLVVQQFAMGV
jgi:hypothetical protein